MEHRLSTHYSDFVEIPGFPGNYASKEGKIRGKSRNFVVGGIHHGRPYQVLNGRRRLRAHLILETFVGECPLGHRVSYRDGNVKNCRAENLFWEPTLRHLERKKKPLTHSDVLGILWMCSCGDQLRAVGHRYGRSSSTIQRVLQKPVTYLATVRPAASP